MKNQVIHETSKTVVIATGLDRLSNNKKTGNMVQIWIMLKDVNPVEAVATGIDASTVCKGCPFASGNGCYVNVGQAPLMIWKAYRANKYPRLLPKDYARAFGGRKVRFGAYGNPSLIPLSMVKAIAKVSNGWTGYFHDWHMMSKAKAKAYSEFFMASTDTEESRLHAVSLKMRYFHVSPNKPSDAVECLSESKSLACEQCLLCAGNSKSRLKSIWINPHGSKKAKAVKAAMA